MELKFLPLRVFSFCFLLSLSPLFSESTEPQVKEQKVDEDIAKASESLGRLIGKHLENLGVPLDVHLITKGLEAAYNGASTEDAEKDFYRAITSLQKDRTQQPKLDAKEAEKFLEANRHKEGIITKENGKLQYKILHPGKGNSVEPYNAPIITYKAYYLDGTEYKSASEAERISLDETVIGFKKGVIGMREGEKRILYIHPDLINSNLSSEKSSLIIFEVEVIRADGSSTSSNLQQMKGEVAGPCLEDEHELR